jgi:transposase InsO family protein
LAGLVERSRRPLCSPLQTDSSIEDQVEALRRRYPDWGARKLKVMLARQGIDLPRSTIHRILIRRGLVQDEVRNPSATIRFERAQPNELWQMDFKGPKSWPQPVGPLTVLDDHSRYVIALYASGSTTAGPVREQLESAFWNCGLPDGMLMDHGIPWWHSRAPMGASQISLWLIRQGIRLHWSRLRHPQTQGKVERFHGELQRALDRRHGPGNDLQHWLDQFRWEHNNIRPHEALGMATPATRWHPSLRRYDPNPPRWQYPEGAWVRKVDNTGKLKLKGRNWNISQALTGEWVQLLEVEDRIQVYYCNTLIRELDLEIHRSTIVERWIPVP